MNNANDYMMLIIGVLVIVLCAYMPYIIDRTIAFGIRIPKGQYKNERIVKIKKTFKNSVLIVGAILTFLTFYLSNKSEIYLLIYILLIIVVYIIFYFYAYKAMKKLKEELKWEEKRAKIVIDTDFRKGKITMNSKWYIIQAVIVIVTAIIMLANYSNLPAQLATNYDLAGNAVGFMPKNKALIITLGTQIFMIILMFLINLSFKKVKQELNGDASKDNIEREQNKLLIMSRFIYAISLITQLMFFAIALSMCGVLQSMQVVAALSVILIIVLVISIIAIIKSNIGKGEKKVNLELNNDEYLNDDDNWKFGMFYVNRNDPSYFVKKRMGIGYTLNFGHKSVIIGFTIFMMLILLLVVYSE